MHRYVEVQDQNGVCYDGIVEYIDDHTLGLAVPGAIGAQRAFGQGFGPGPFPFRPRRFSKLELPLYTLTALSLLPYY